MPEALARDLKRVVTGDVLDDPISLQLYSTAACIFSIKPKVVVCPKSADDVAATVKYAKEHAIPVTARGAGSGLAGQTLGEGIIIDFSRHMNRILEVNQVRSEAIVEPGVVLGDLNRRLKGYGLWFPPDPSSGDVATIGGMIANNAAGARSMKYGATREHIAALELVMNDGSRAWTDGVKRETARYDDCIRQTADLIRAKRDLIAKHKPDVLKNSSGYHVYDEILQPQRLIAGSEGTLAIVTAAKLKIQRLPTEKVLLRVFYGDLDRACKAVVKLRKLGPSALELLDKTIIDLVRGHSMEWSEIMPAGLKTVLLCEFDGDDSEKVRDTAERAADLLKDAIEVHMGSGEEHAALWKIRKAASPILDRLEGPLRSTRIIEDAAVHPDKLPQYIKGLKEIFERHEVEGVIFGHAGSGHIHCNVLMNPHGDQDKIEALCGEVAYLVATLKGTLSGEHGDGILRAAYLRTIFGPLVDLFAEIKGAWDPSNLLNPGKKIAPANFDFRKHLRPSRRPDTGYVAGAFDAKTQEIEKCNGCGHCRTYCPVHIEMGDEASTPRAKANALTGVLRNEVKIDPALRTLADLCINCKLCWEECPAGVDIPGLCLDAKALDVQARGLSARDRRFINIRESAGTMANIGLSVPLAKQMLGLAKRKFPKFKRGDAKPTKSSERKVIYFPGCHADLNDPEEKRATIEVLEKNGFEVLMPEPGCCGLPALSLGSRMDAIDSAMHFLSTLPPGDVPIVTSAPSCGLMLREELPVLLPELDKAKDAAKRIFDIHEFLWKLHEEKKLDTGFKRLPASVLFHPACHMRAMGADKAAKSLLKLIPDLQLVEAPEYCCGQAGSFGFKAESWELSKAIAKHAVDEYRRKNPTYLLTSNGTCKHQLEEGLNREMMHSIVLLHRAYGLAPFEGLHRVPESLAIKNMAAGMDRSSGDR